MLLIGADSLAAGHVWDGKCMAVCRCGLLNGRCQSQCLLEYLTTTNAQENSVLQAFILYEAACSNMKRYGARFLCHFSYVLYIPVLTL